jgi:hypothetical protein
MDLEGWRQLLVAQRRELLEDDEQDDLLMGVLVDQLGDGHEFEVRRGRHGGSKPGRRPNLQRDRLAGHERIYRDYFADEPVFGPELFRRRYRMSRELFLRIMEEVCAHDSFFVQKCDAAGVMGLSSIQKCTAALRMLAYGISADGTDEYCRLGESTAMLSLKRFVVAVRAVFEARYLRQPTREDLEKQISINTDRGFPGMFASVDCMHWEWKNCPVAWQGQFQDKDKNRSIILKAIADQSLWIWHAFFGLPRSNNDLTVLDRSPLIHDMLRGSSSGMTFVVNGVEYSRYYLLADGIYPSWSCFVQSIHEPADEKRAHYSKVQEACRKDVERCFGVLQSRFAIIQNPSRHWSQDTISDIMIACVVLHNMVIEDEQENNLQPILEINAALQFGHGVTFEELAAATQEIEDEDVHFSLRGDLIEHLWALKGSATF